MNTIIVSITLNDDWDEYFDKNMPTDNELILEDLFDGFNKDGVEKIEIISK